MPSADSRADELSYQSCVELLTDAEAPPSRHNTLKQLQCEVRHRHQSGEISSDAIRAHADDDRDARIQALQCLYREQKRLKEEADGIIAQQNHALAASFARIKELETLCPVIQNAQ